MQHHTSLRSCNTIRWLYNINLLHIRIVLLMPLPIISKMLNGYYTYHIPPWRATQQLWGKKISKVEKKFKQIHYYSLWVLEVGTHNTADLCSRDGTTDVQKGFSSFLAPNTYNFCHLNTETVFFLRISSVGKTKGDEPQQRLTKKPLIGRAAERKRI